MKPEDYQSASVSLKDWFNADTPENDAAEKSPETSSGQTLVRIDASYVLGPDAHQTVTLDQLPSVLNRLLDMSPTSEIRITAVNDDDDVSTETSFSVGDIVTVPIKNRLGIDCAAVIVAVYADTVDATVWNIDGPGANKLVTGIPRSVCEATSWH